MYLPTHSNPFEKKSKSFLKLLRACLSYHPGHDDSGHFNQRFFLILIFFFVNYHPFTAQPSTSFK